eukprot:GFKZ01003767.1.p6 GENE.GFKZ01003767.1~~GFKZ01003767.1.p6  ORF type:complete len:108 (-),score=25.18 GFKZ01003767.1:406-729(-)
MSVDCIGRSGTDNGPDGMVRGDVGDVDFGAEAVLSEVFDESGNVGGWEVEDVAVVVGVEHEGAEEEAAAAVEEGSGGGGGGWGGGGAAEGVDVVCDESVQEVGGVGA